MEGELLHTTSSRWHGSLQLLFYVCYTCTVVYVYEFVVQSGCGVDYRDGQRERLRATSSRRHRYLFLYRNRQR